MKKTLLITLDFPPDIGGVAAYYANICSHLDPKNITVLTNKRKESENVDSAWPFEIIRKDLISQKKPSIWKWGGGGKHIRKTVQERGIEALIAGQILPIGTLVYLLKNKTKIPYYVFSHGMDLSILRGRKKIIARQVLKNSAGVIVNSMFTKHLVEKFGIPHDKILVLYPCPNKLPQPNDLTLIETLNRHGLRNKKILLTVARIVERKGVDLVIRALSEIKKSIPNAVYIVSGAGPMRASLEKIAENLGVQDSVVFTGETSPEELSALYELCNVFIMTPKKMKNGDVEGFGMVYLEANLYGKPVIATRTGGVPEAVIHEETGLISKSEDPADIAKAAIRLLSDEALSHRLGMQGMDRAHNEFEWWMQTDKLKNLLS